MKRLLAFLLLLLFVLAVPAFAHSGRTDSSGGHNSSTGYHYHHGYPPHNHTDGACPYDFDDQTGKSSGAGSGNNNATSENSDADTTEKQTTVGADLIALSITFSPLLLLLLWPFVLSPIRSAIEKRKKGSPK